MTILGDESGQSDGQDHDFRGRLGMFGVMGYL